MPSELRELLTRAGLTAKAAAGLLGLPPWALVVWRHSPPKKHVDAMARYNEAVARLREIVAAREAPADPAEVRDLAARVADMYDLCRRAGWDNSRRLLKCSDDIIRLYRLGRQVPTPKFWRRFDRVRDQLEELAKTWPDLRRERQGAIIRLVNARSRKEACRQNFERIRDEELNVYGHRIGFATLFQKSRKASDGVGFVWGGKKKTYYFTCAGNTCAEGSTSNDAKD